MGVTIQYLGWDAFIITTVGGVRILLDPFLIGNEFQKVAPSPFQVEDIAVDFIAVSHGSTDHFGQAFDIMRNGKNDRTKLFCGVDVWFHSEHTEFEQERIELMVAGCRYDHEDFVIRAVDARHISWTRHNGFPVTGPAICYILMLKGGPTIFFGGDTAVTMDMKLWGELYRPDVALLGVGGTDFRGRTIDELDPYEAAVAADMLGAKLIIPMHYVSVDKATEFEKHLHDRVPSARCRIMEPGEILSL